MQVEKTGHPGFAFICGFDGATKEAADALRLSAHFVPTQHHITGPTKH